jgi:hypothetical protein
MTCFLVCQICSTFADSPLSLEAQGKIKNFGIWLAKENEMKYLNRGCGLILDSPRILYELSLMSHHAWTIEEARPVIVGMIYHFLNLLYNDKTIVAHVKYIHELMPKAKTPDLTHDKIGLKIGFWDMNIDRPLPPHLAQIKVVEGKIFYYQANPKDQTLQEPPFSENFEEAFRRVGRPLIQPHL